MMLEKISVIVSDEGASMRDKEFKRVEKQRLQSLIERHDALMPQTMETQEKVEVYALCYAYGDEIGPFLNTLTEYLYTSTKEIHPHSLKMVEEHIEKMEKVRSRKRGD